MKKETSPSNIRKKTITYHLVSFSSFSPFLFCIVRIFNFQSLAFSSLSTKTKLIFNLNPRYGYYPYIYEMGDSAVPKGSAWMLAPSMLGNGQFRFHLGRTYLSHPAEVQSKPFIAEYGWGQHPCCPLELHICPISIVRI